MATICKKLAMAPVDRYGACPQKAPVGPRVASGPGVHASCHLARVCGMPQVMIHAEPLLARAKSGPNKSVKQKPETSYSNRGYASPTKLLTIGKISAEKFFSVSNYSYISTVIKNKQ